MCPNDGGGCFCKSYRIDESVSVKPVFLRIVQYQIKPIELVQLQSLPSVLIYGVVRRHRLTFDLAAFARRVSCRRREKSVWKLVNNI